MKKTICFVFFVFLCVWAVFGRKLAPLSAADLNFWIVLFAASVLLFMFVGLGVEKIKRYFVLLCNQSFLTVFGLFSFLSGMAGLCEFLLRPNFSLLNFLGVYGTIISLAALYHFWRPLKKTVGWQDVLTIGVIGLAYGSGLPMLKGAYGYLTLVSLLLINVCMRQLQGFGYTFNLNKRDLKIVVLYYLGFAAVGIPLGYFSGYIHFEFILPSPSFVLMSAIRIFLSPALVEEIIFRGLFQNYLTQKFNFKHGRLLALVSASVLFGVLHSGDPRYLILAGVAGLFYGGAYIHTGKIVPAALVHTLVDLRHLYGIGVIG